MLDFSLPWARRAGQIRSNVQTVPLRVRHVTFSLIMRGITPLQPHFSPHTPAFFSSFISFHITMGAVRKTSRRELSPTLRARIWERYNCIKNVSAVAAHFKQHRSTVSSLINRLKKQDVLDFYTRPRPARPKKPPIVKIGP
jgi:hypothetical protein